MARAFWIRGRLVGTIVLRWIRGIAGMRWLAVGRGTATSRHLGNGLLLGGQKPAAPTGWQHKKTAVQANQRSQHGLSHGRIILSHGDASQEETLRKITEHSCCKAHLNRANLPFDRSFRSKAR
jgi:hypothetical protein